jgi:hypothetical protein
VPEDWRHWSTVKSVTLGPDLDKEGPQTANSRTDSYCWGVLPQAARGGARSGRIPEASDSKSPTGFRGPNRSLATPWQVSMKGNGSGLRLWSCLLGRHPGDMETYGRPDVHHRGTRLQG